MPDKLKPCWDELLEWLEDNIEKNGDHQNVQNRKVNKKEDVI